MERHRSGLYRPCLQDGASRRGEDLMSVDQCEAIREMDDSQLVGAPEAGGGAGEDGRVAEVEVKTVDARLEKKKRGRPPSGLPKAVKTTAAPRKKKDEEDVCFICFDGGSLVLCDRRGCPKAYHPACIKRDESFFKSRAKWNCGWHICSICQKAAHYMCYTCTYSLCKGCIKDADYLSVRGNNGLCGTCMRTVMLIENLQGDKEVAQVDFDDKSSWEYLFKMYWIFLKGKLSLASDELTRAKNPWKGIDTLSCKGEPSAEHLKVDDCKGSSFNNSCAGLEANNSKRRKTKKQPAINNKGSLTMERSGNDNSSYPLEGLKWASKELLEFVAHMKNGDTSMLSQFDVQTLLQEYIKKNNLRDPHQKCQIVCDSRLTKLFGKERVGHIEMLKLLESHFLVKESCSADDILRMGVVNIVASQMKTEANDDNQLLLGSGRRRKIRKKADERGSKINLDAFAAIDVHNVNLIYLWRNLMEALMDDADKFHDKVVGSVVRISIPNNDQKQEMYRLVQVVGTRKVAEPYKLGERTTDMMLEILNLDKKDTISIKDISNQEFSEDECERLRQSVKCGLIKKLTVGEIRAKAMILQAVRVNDGLEAEISRLNHLRDRASEKGHKKELRECVEKLQLLNSPDEHQRRLNEIPEVHTDPKMDPSYEFGDNVGEVYGKKQDVKLRSKLFGNGRKGGKPASARKGGDVLDNIGNCVQKNLAKSYEQSRKVGVTSSWNQEREASGMNRWNTPANQVNTSGSLAISWNNQTVVRSELSSGLASEISRSAVSTETGQSTNDFEIQKLWYYRDPAGRIQGPFSILQLRKWSTTGHFPSNLRVWRTNEQQDDSVLLTDALSGRYYKAPSLPGNNKLLSSGVGVASDDKDNIHDGGGSGSMNASWIHGKEVDESSKLKQVDSSVHANGNDDFLKSNGYGTHSPSWTNPADVTNTEGRMNAVTQRGWDSSNSSSTLPNQLGPHSPSWTNPADVTNSNERMNAVIQPRWDSSNGSSALPDPLPGCSSSITPPASSGKSCETLSHEVREGHGAESNSALESGKCNSHSTADGQTKNERGYENQSDSEGHSGQSSGQSSRPLPVTSNGLISNSDFISVVKSLETAEKNQEIDFPDFPSSTTPQQSNEDSKVLAAESKQAASSSVPIQDAGPSWSTASSLVGGGAQIPEVVGEWPRHSPTPAKHSAEEWDASLGSAPSMKPAEMVSDHTATQTSISEQLTQSSPPHPASNTSSWPAAISTEPTEFGSLAGESVSDLLAEVEAMESLDGLPSPTSNMNCGETLTEDSKNDCISALDGFSPAFDPGKGDALSSTGDLQVPSQSTVTDEPHGVCQADALDTQKRSTGHSPTSIEVEGDAKPNDIPVNQWKRGSDIQPTRPSRASWNMAARETTWRVGSESTATSWGPVQGSANLGWGGFDQRSVNTGWGTGHVPTPDRLCTNLPASAGNPGIWGPQPRYGGDRSSSPRDRGFPGRDIAYGWGRGTWSRQPPYVGGNGGGPHRHVPKGQRICKYYGSGNCWKGASCDYWHP